jgi:hypothetical protein
MSPKAFTAFRVAPELLEAMREIKATQGIPMSVQVDFALRNWMEAKGVKVKSAKPARVKRTGKA